MIVHNKSIFTIALASLTLTLFCGCARVRTRHATESLLLRVKQMAQAKIAGDWAAVYSLMSPSYKNQVPKATFLARKRKIKFTAYEIRNIKIIPSKNEATVKIAWNISMGGYNFKNAPETQHWVYVDGNWYLRPTRPQNPFRK